MMKGCKVLLPKGDTVGAVRLTDGSYQAMKLDEEKKLVRDPEGQKLIDAELERIKLKRESKKSKSTLGRKEK